VLPGRNFVAGNTDARDDSLIGHGTLVAGVAAATTNNGIGIAGAAWNASVLPVKVLDSHGYGTDSQVAAGIVWAADHGANVVNLSLGGPTSSGDALCDATTYAQSQGALVVAAAGNAANGWLNYPAACPGVVGVSATDAQGDFASFSSFGPDVGIAAPGLAVTSTRNDNRYGTESGTSLSAPIVSGVAALVDAMHPDWSAAQVAERLEDTAQDRGPPGVDLYYGHGLLDAYAALGGPTQAPDVPKRDGLEPNNDSARATPLQKAAKATIAPEGDVDWYVTSLRWPALLRLDVVAPPYDSHTGPNLRPVAQLFDADGNRLVTDAPDTQTARITARLPAGLYYLRVANGCGARSAGTYMVSLSVKRSPGIIGRLIP
jgi:serine protease